MKAGLSWPAACPRWPHKYVSAVGARPPVQTCTTMRRWGQLVATRAVVLFSQQTLATHRRPCDTRAPAPPSGQAATSAAPSSISAGPRPAALLPGRAKQHFRRAAPISASAGPRPKPLPPGRGQQHFHRAAASRRACTSAGWECLPRRAWDVWHRRSARLVMLAGRWVEAARGHQDPRRPPTLVAKRAPRTGEGEGCRLGGFPERTCGYAGGGSDQGEVDADA
jgi:hypothetical protein